MIPEAITHFLPGKLFRMNGEDYKDLVWLDEGDKPTKKQIDDWVIKYKAIREKEKTNYRIISQIEELEKKLIRPMTSLINNTASDSDRTKFNELKSQIAELRSTLL
jgi:hypothetical protein